MTIRARKTRLRLFALLGAFLFIPGAAQAQLLGFNLRGDAGMKSGSQPGPGIYLIAPLYLRADYNGLRDRNGDEILSGLNLDVNLWVVPGLAVTTKPRSRAELTASRSFRFGMDQRLTLAAPGFRRVRDLDSATCLFSPSAWDGERRRLTSWPAMPSWPRPGPSTRSLDMWGHELSAGTTVYLDSEKKWHVAATGFYDFHQKKQDQDLTVGQYLTIEGGVGRSFLKGAAHVGLAYVAQWKTTNDTGSDFPPNLQKSKNRAYGMGPEIALPVFARGPLVGLVNLRYIWEFGAETNFEGGDFLISFTLARLSH